LDMPLPLSKGFAYGVKCEPFGHSRFDLTAVYDGGCDVCPILGDEAYKDWPNVRRAVRESGVSRATPAPGNDFGRWRPGIPEIGAKKMVQTSHLI